MKKTSGFAARIAGAGALALLLGVPVFAAPAPQTETVVYRTDRLSTQGRISSISREGDMYRLTLENGSYSYLVPVTMVGSRNLAVGSDVRLDGIVTGDGVNVDMVAVRGENYYTSDPYYHGVPYGRAGWLSGTVQRVDRHLGYLVLRDDATGNEVKIDVRHMNMRRPVNVWGIRSGDHISVNGSWEHRDTFDATRVEY